jgi:lipoprotein-releasing system permease protein
MNRGFMHFISSRFNSQKAARPSLRAMRRIAVAGIALASAALVIALSIGSGFEREYIKRLMDFNAHIIVTGPGEIMDDGSIERNLLDMKGDASYGIVEVSPFIYREALAIADSRIKGVVLKGMRDEDIQKLSKGPLDWSTEGSNAFHIAVGRQFLEGSYKGDAIKAMIPVGSRQRFVEFRKAGEFESGIYDFDSQFFLMPIDEMRRLFEIKGGTVSGFELRLLDPMSARRIAARIEEKLGPLIEVTTWEELNLDIIKAVRLEKLMASLIMGGMVIVAMLNIIAVMVLITVSRISEVAVLKALGLGTSLVVRLLMKGGMRMALLGICSGMAIGLSISFIIGRWHLIPLDPEIYLIDSLPIDISIPICGMIAAFCIVCGYFASLLASRKLSRFEVMEGLARIR